MIPPKHTPGPWVVKSTDEDINTKTVIDSTEFWIAKVLNFNRASDDIGESQANAHLIAAAPAMYTLLQDATLQLARLTGSNLETYARTFSVLAKKALAQAENKP